MCNRTPYTDALVMSNVGHEEHFLSILSIENMENFDQFPGHFAQFCLICLYIHIDLSTFVYIFQGFCQCLRK